MENKKPFQVNGEQAKKLFDKGYISEEMYKNIANKYASGGVVSTQSSPSIDTSNPIAQILSAAASNQPQSISPELAQKVEAAKANTAVQQDRYMGPRADINVPANGFGGNAVADDARQRLNFRNSQTPAPLAMAGERASDDLLPQTSEQPQGQVAKNELEQAGLQKVTQQPQAPSSPSFDARKTQAATYDKAFDQWTSSVGQEAAAASKMASAQAAAYTTAEDNLKQWEENRRIVEEKRKEREQEQFNILQQRMEDVNKTAAVDPNRYWANKSTGDKIMAGIGIFLGGLGRQGGNDALQIVQNAINRDIDAQKTQAQQKMNAFQMQNNLYKSMLDQFGDERSAEHATRLMMMNMLEMNIKKVEAQNQGPMIQARSQQALATIGLKKAEIQGELAKAYANSPQNMAADEVTKKILSLPQDMRSEAFKELGEYRGIESNLKQLDRVYDSISGSNTVGSYASSPLQTRSKLQKAEADLFPIVKSIVGEKMTDSDARILIASQLPKLTDNSKTITQKKDDLIKALQSKISERAPRLTGLGIVSTPKSLDLKRND